MENIELIDNGDNKSVDFKLNNTDISFDNCIDSYVFWANVENQANRAMYKIKQMNPGKIFNFSLQSMMVTPEERRRQFLAHVKNKHSSVNAELAFKLIDEEVAKITMNGPDDNHPNPFHKFELSSDIVKTIFIAVMDRYQVDVRNQPKDYYNK
jgi:hypothetical protein